MHLFLLLVALLGHAFLWVALVNRIHGTSMPRWATKLLTATCGAGVTLVPVGFGWSYFRSDFAGFDTGRIPAAVLLYLVTCWVAAGCRHRLVGSAAACGVDRRTSCAAIARTRFPWPPIRRRPPGNATITSWSVCPATRSCNST